MARDFPKYLSVGKEHNFPRWWKDLIVSKVKYLNTEAEEYKYRWFCINK